MKSRSIPEPGAKETDGVDPHRPQVSVGHVVLHTSRMDETVRFMLAVGLRSVFSGPEVSVLELRGGTHLLLFHSEAAVAGEAAFDLMVDDLHSMHHRLAERGYTPSPIEHRPDIGHETFDVVEPSGTRIRFFSSHATCEVAKEFPCG